MKKLYALLMLSIFYSAMLTAEPSINHKKPIIITDFDEVWVEKPYWLETLAHLQFLLKDTKNKNAPKKTARLATVTLQLLDYGRRHPRLALFVPTLIRMVGKSRNIIDGTHCIYRYLKEQKGYTIVIATNRDRISYDLTMEKLGKKIMPIITKAFVFEGVSDQDAIAQLKSFAFTTTPINDYQMMLKRVLNVKPTDTIIHIPTAKPNVSYFNVVVNNLGADHDMIFIDDMLDNVISFKSLQQQTKALRHGIQFLNPQQLAQELVKCGILSEADDREFLQEINYPGIIGSITSGIKHAFMKLKTAIS
jgi:hypothetical protein